MSFHTRDHLSSPPLPQETSLSDYTVDSNTTFVETPATAPTPGSPVHHRPGYRRITSLNDQDTAYHGPEYSPHRRENSHGHGLGIKNLKPLPSAPPRARSNYVTPASADPLLSPPPMQSQRGYRPLDNDPLPEGNEPWDENASRNEPFQPFVADSETESLRNQTPAATVQSFESPGTLELAIFRSFPHPPPQARKMLLWEDHSSLPILDPAYCSQPSTKVPANVRYFCRTRVPSQTKIASWERQLARCIRHDPFGLLYLAVRSLAWDCNCQAPVWPWDHQHWKDAACNSISGGRRHCEKHRVVFRDRLRHFSRASP